MYDELLNEFLKASSTGELLLKGNKDGNLSPPWENEDKSESLFLTLAKSAIYSPIFLSPSAHLLHSNHQISFLQILVSFHDISWLRINCPNSRRLAQLGLVHSIIDIWMFLDGAKIIPYSWCVLMEVVQWVNISALIGFYEEWA